MSKEISNNDDIIDSRDVIERMDELESQNDETPFEEDSDESHEYSTLKALAAEASGYAPDWEYGETLIRDSYFEEYARGLVEELGVLPADLPYWVEIDWEETACNVQMDYSAVEFDGVTYWVR